MVATHISSLILLLFAASAALAWSVDQTSCSQTEVGVQAIVDAVDEAIDIAQYAAFRMDNGPAPGGIVEQLLGSSGRQSFTGMTWLYSHHLPCLNYIDKMTQLPMQVGPKANLDNTVDVVCGTQYLQQASDGSWFDNRFDDMPSFDPFHGDPSRQPCTSAGNSEDIAFGFPTALGEDSPQWVVVLCSAATDRQETFNDRIFGDDWEDVGPVVSIELTNQFISTIVLHEFLHFANPSDRRSTISCSLSRSLTHLTVPDKLSNGDEEVYTFDEITSLPDNVRAENTESYALLASGT
jgi:hypothetical protein